MGFEQNQPVTIRSALFGKNLVTAAIKSTDEQIKSIEILLSILNSATTYKFNAGNTISLILRETTELARSEGSVGYWLQAKALILIIHHYKQVIQPEDTTIIKQLQRLLVVAIDTARQLTQYCQASLTEYFGNKQPWEALNILVSEEKLTASFISLKNSLRHWQQSIAQSTQDNIDHFLKQHQHSDTHVTTPSSTPTPGCH